MRRLVVEADGGSRGNPGPAGYGALVRDAASGAVLAEVAESIGTATNNVAEYRGLIAGLTAAREVDPGADVEVRMDSKLVVEQMSGRWQVKHAGMRELVREAQALAPQRVRFTWIPRAQNSHADRLANEAMDAAAAGRAWRPRDSDDASPAVPRADLGEPATLVLVRHGRTALTHERRLYGWGGSDPGLDEGGHDDARRVSLALAARGDVGAVVSSPMRRTLETAAVVGAELGLDVVEDAAWREIAFGEWDGATVGELAGSAPADVARWQSSLDVAPPGGETMTALLHRVSTARANAARRWAGEVVAVVTHATPVKAVVAEALGAVPLALWRLQVAPASLTVTRWWSDGGAEVVAVNDTAHLR